jgi:hypothetical protein
MAKTFYVPNKTGSSFLTGKPVKVYAPNKVGNTFQTAKAVKMYAPDEGYTKLFWGGQFVPPAELYYPNAPYPDPLVVFKYTAPFHLLQWGVNDYVFSVADNTDDVFVVIYEVNGTVAPYFFSDGYYNVGLPGGVTDHARAYDHSGIETFYCFQIYSGFIIHPSYPLPYNTMDQLRDFYGWDTAYMKKHCTNVVVS